MSSILVYPIDYIHFKSFKFCENLNPEGAQGALLIKENYRYLFYADVCKSSCLLCAFSANDRFRRLALLCPGLGIFSVL